MNLRLQKGMIIYGIKIAMRYRWEALIAILTTPLALIIYYRLWNSIYTYTGQTIIQGFSFPQMMNYYALSMIVGFFTWSEVDKWMESDVIHGWLLRGMIRPVSIITWYLSFEIGMNFYNILTQLVPVYIIAYLFFALPVATTAAFLAFALSLFFAFLLYFGLAFLLGLSSFWIKRITGLRRVRRTIIAFFGGSFIPLAFFPKWLATIVNYLPFPYIRSVPILIYQQRIPIIQSLIIQLAWVIALYILIAIVAHNAMKRYASAGL